MREPIDSTLKDSKYKKGKAGKAVKGASAPKAPNSSAAPVDDSAEGGLFAKPLSMLKSFGRGTWNVIKQVGSGLLTVLSALWDAAKAVGRFMARNWKTISAILLAVAIGAGIAALIVFAFPAVIPAIAAFSLTLPLIGTIAPFAFLGTLGTAAAAAVIGAVGGVVSFLGLELGHAAVAVTNLIDKAFQWLGGNSKADQQEIQIRGLEAENRGLKAENAELQDECYVTNSHAAFLLNRLEIEPTEPSFQSSRSEKEAGLGHGSLFRKSSVKSKPNVVETYEADTDADTDDEADDFRPNAGK